MIVDSITLASILLILLAAVLVARATGRGQSIWSTNYLWFALLWIVAYVISLSGILKFNSYPSLETAAFIVAAHLSFVMGTMLAMVWAPLRITHDYSMPPAAPLTPVVLVLATGLVCQLLQLFDRAASTGINLQEALALSDLQGIREANFVGVTSRLGPLLLPVTVGSSLVYVGLAMFAYHFGSRARWAKPTTLVGLLAISAFLVAAFYHLFVLGGRGPLLQMAVISAWAWALGRSTVTKENARRVWRLVITTAILLIPASLVSTWFQTQRDDAGPFGMIWLLKYTLDAAPGEILGPLGTDKFLGFYLLQLGYLSAPPHLLEIYTSLGDRFPGPFFGLYNFGHLYGLVAPVFGGAATFIELRSILFQPLVVGGHAGNLWTTLLRDLYADFGYIGTLLFLFLFGVCVQRASDSFARRPTAVKAVWISLLRLVCLWSAFHSLFFIDKIIWALAICFVLMFVFRYRAATDPRLVGNVPIRPAVVKRAW